MYGGKEEAAGRGEGKLSLAQPSEADKDVMRPLGANKVHEVEEEKEAMWTCTPLLSERATEKDREEVRKCRRAKLMDAARRT